VAERLGVAVMELRTDDAGYLTGVDKAEGRAKRLDRSLVKTERTSKSLGARLSKLGGRLGNVGKRLFSLRTAAVTAAGITGFLLLVKRSIKVADQIGKTADKIGLGVAALQELRFAASEAGVENNVFDLSMQRFSRRFGEAVAGGGELLPVLKQYNIATRDADGRTRSLEDALADYADVVANAESEQEQLRLSFKAFDSEGAALVILMRRGSEGIRKLRAEARSLGIVIDTAMVRQAEEAQDQLGRLGQVLGVNLIRAVLAVSPTVVQLGKAFAQAAPHIANFVNRLLPDSAAASDELRSRMIGIEEVIFRISGMNMSQLLQQDSLAQFGDDADKIRNLLGQLRELDIVLKQRVQQESIVKDAIEGGSRANAEQTAKVAELKQALQFEREQLDRTERCRQS